ncbi:RNA transcription, translation and transport factor protein [Anabrus simplex]|uniref:RNA transcription, translation and transport factor protein n=1 Tax=Anabrus simplex TaxID=316456 RepID=UPI0034DDABC9
MFKRKLTALDYPSPDNFNANDDKQFRNLVIWLEDQKVRHYKIEDRKALRDIDSPTWPKVFSQYLSDVACPIQSDNKIEHLQWLLGFSIRLEYADNVDKYKGQTSETVKKTEMNAPKIVSANPLDNLDFDSPDFKKGVNALAQLLHVTPHKDHLITLKAVSKVACHRLSAEALENPDTVIVKGKPFPFRETELGFQLGDNVLNDAANILRLLYIHDLRDLQTRINESIVSVQSVTANPKTDTKLGKVGF